MNDLGVGFVACIAVLVIMATIFPEKPEHETATHQEADERDEHGRSI